MSRQVTNMSTFASLIQVLDFFKDEETCKAYLEQQRWSGNVECPFCACTKVYRTNRGFKCGDKFCGKKFSVTVGTIYENSKVPLRTWFAAMYLITAHKKGISSCQLARDLNITQKTAWFVLHCIREMLKIESEDKLSNMVEVDETYIGGKYKNMHKAKRAKAHLDNVSHTNNKTTVVGLLERNNKVRTTILVRSEDTLKGMVRKHVDTSAILVTDSFIAYKGLNKEYAQHEVVNHILDEYVRGQWHTNTIEGFWSLLKRGIYGIYHQVSPKHLQRYCEEFSYRYNSRKIKDTDRFELTFKFSERRLTYNQLVGKDGK